MRTKYPKGSWQNPEFRRAYGREWNKNHKRVRLDYYQQYYKDNTAKIVARVAAWRRDNPGCRSAEHVQRRYRLTHAEYVQRVLDQKGLCAICGVAPKKKTGRRPISTSITIM